MAGEGTARADARGGPRTRRARAALALAGALAVVLAIAPGTIGATHANETGTTDASPARDTVIGGTPVGTTRVLHGDVPVPDAWPSVVALVSPGLEAAADRQFCAGTVIASRWVLTAAHCLYGERHALGPADLRVIAGARDLRADVVEERHVVNLFVHPGYDHAAGDAYDDIALIELAHALEPPAARLYGRDAEALGPAPGVVVGWGATAFEDPRRAEYPDALQHAVVPLVSRSVCNAPISYDGYVGSGQLCAGFPEGGVDSCVGDSGGPLFVDTGGQVEQVGIVSYGRDCAQPLFYGIYTDVAVYRGWVSEYVALPPALGDDDAGAGAAAWWLVLGGVVLVARRRSTGTRCGSCRSSCGGCRVP